MLGKYLILLCLMVSAPAFAQSDAPSTGNAFGSGSPLGNPFLPGGSDTDTDAPSVDAGTADDSLSMDDEPVVAETCDLSYRKLGSVSLGDDPAQVYYVVTAEDCTEHLVTPAAGG